MSFRKPLRILLALLLIIVGLTALLTPFTPGSWLALIGLLMLGVPMPQWVREWLHRLRKRQQ